MSKKTLFYVLFFVYIILLVPIVSGLESKAVRFIVTDSYGNPLEGAIVTLETLENTYVLPPSNKTGITQSINPIPKGKYWVTVKWRSPYADDFSLVFGDYIELDEPYIFELRVRIFSIVIKLFTRGNTPLSDIPVYINGRSVGFTSIDGSLRIPNIITGLYEVRATWLGIEIGSGSVVIESEGDYVITARNVATLTVQVVGAQGQGLNAAQVEVKNITGATMFSGVSNEQGVARIEVPYGTYNVSVDYKSFKNSALATVSTLTGTVQTLATNVFIEIFGQAMTFATFVLWIIVIVIVVLVLAIVVHEYSVWRVQTLPRLYKRYTVEPEKREEPKPPIKKDRKKLTRSWNIKDVLTFISFSAILSVTIVVVPAIFFNIVMGDGLTPREIMTYTLQLFGTITAALFVEIYIKTPKKKSKIEFEKKKQILESLF